MLNSNKESKVSKGIKIVLFLIVALVLLYILKNNQRLDILYWNALRKGWESRSWLLVMVVLFIPINWSLEALKWKFLIRDIEKISYKRALESVVVGVSLGFITPHSIGDYAARIFSLTKPERLKGLGAVFLCRISQFYITLFFGSLGVVVYLFFVLKQTSDDYWQLAFFTFLVNLFFLIMLLFYKKILKFLLHRKPTKKISSYFLVLEKYSNKELRFVLFLSFIRYCVFCFQFVLLLIYFNITLELWLLFAGVWFIFFVKSIVPTIMDLGIRELAAIGFFGTLCDNHQNVIFGSLTLWLLNLVFPAIVGLFLLNKIRLFNKDKV